MYKKIIKENKMKQFTAAMDGLPKILKIVLSLPMLSIIWVVYRIVNSVANNNTLGIVLGILLLVLGFPFIWLIDIITIIVMDKVLWID